MRNYLAKLLLAVFAIVAFQVGLLAAPSYASTGNSCGGKQQDVNWVKPGSNYIHHWLGYCPSFSNYQYYSGMDDRWSWGGTFHQINYEYIHTRAWCSGNLVFDASSTLYDTTVTNYLNTGWFYNCSYGVQTDSYAHWTQNGVFDATNYFNTNGF